MAQEIIFVGSSGNDGTGDPLRIAFTKVNNNFTELFSSLGGASVLLQDSSLVYVGADDGFETRLRALPSTADNVILLPNASGVIVLTTLTQSLTNKTLVSPIIEDDSGADLVAFSSDSDAVNHITIRNAATTVNPIIGVAGTDSDITLEINSKGIGSISVNRLALETSTMLDSGEVGSLSSHIDCNKATSLTLTLADGNTPGEQKIFTNRGVGNAVVTPVSFAHGTSFTLAQNEACTLTWDGFNWFITGNFSVVTIT